MVIFDIKVGTITIKASLGAEVHETELTAVQTYALLMLGLRTIIS